MNFMGEGGWLDEEKLKTEINCDKSTVCGDWVK